MSELFLTPRRQVAKTPRKATGPGATPRAAGRCVRVGIASSVLGLSGCLTQHATPQLQVQLNQIRDYFASYDSDFEAVVVSAGYDPADVITRAMLGDTKALSDLFAMSQTHLDAASTQGYASYLSRVFRTIGDDRFGSQLATEPHAIQYSVRFYLAEEVGSMLEVRKFDERAIGLLNHYFPITFPQGSIEPTE